MLQDRAAGAVLPPRRTGALTITNAPAGIFAGDTHVAARIAATGAWQEVAVLDDVVGLSLAGGHILAYAETLRCHGPA